MLPHLSNFIQLRLSLDMYQLLVQIFLSCSNGLPIQIIILNSLGQRLVLSLILKQPDLHLEKQLFYQVLCLFC